MKLLSKKSALGVKDVEDLEEVLIVLVIFSGSGSLSRCSAGILSRGIVFSSCAGVTFWEGSLLNL